MAATDRRTGPKRATRHRRRAARRHLPRWLALDLLVALGLGALLAILVVYVTTQPAAERRFSLADQPPDVRLYGFYGPEHNAAGPFRWAKGEAVMLVPVSRPGRYRLTLGLQDGLAQGTGRPTTVYVNGRAVGTFTLAGAPGDYAVDFDLDTAGWLSHGREFQVEIASAAIVPPDDPRPLGIMVRQVAVAAFGPRDPDWALLIAPLLLLVGGYSTLRLLQITTLGAALVGAALIGVFGALLLDGQPSGLLLLYLPIGRPLQFAAALAALLALPAFARVAARARTLSAAAVGTGWWWRNGAGVAAGGVAIGAGILRLYRIDRRSLWLDEGATAFYSGLPWTTVLGLRGWYDLHPPLYYTLVKLAALVAPEEYAGRLVSAIAGTLTVAITYALAARLIDRPIALYTSALLAVSPLHIWYSREARMYVPAMFFVALSYLALIAFGQSADRERSPARYWWAGLYAVSSLLALYTVYSAVYSLLPQAFLLAWCMRGRARRAVPLVVAVGAVVLGYLPWVPQLLGTIQESQRITNREGYLAATPTRVFASFLSVTGLGGGLAEGTAQPLPWQRLQDWQGLLTAGLLGILLLGTAALARRSGLALTVGLSLGAGTIVVAIVVSQLSPGYADRTILVAALGWAMLAGAAALALGRRPFWVGAAGGLAVLLVVAISWASVATLSRGGSRQHYRELVRDAQAAATATGLPLLPEGSWMSAFIRVYAPSPQPVQLPPDSSARFARPDGTLARPDALWLVSSDYSWDDLAATKRRLSDSGYAHLGQTRYPDVLALDLYALPDRSIGTPMPINGTFAGPPTEALGWTLPTSGGRLVAAEGGGRQLVLSNTRPTRTGAATRLAANPAAVYIAAFTISSRVSPNGARVELGCWSANGTTLALITSQDLAPVPNDGTWHTTRLAVLCPMGTAAIQVAAYNTDVGEVIIRDVRLSEARPR